MRPETIEILCNPYKGEPLSLIDGKLVGAASSQSFEIKDGIPVILAEEGLEGRNRSSKILHDMWAFGYDAIVALGDKIQLNSEQRVRDNYIASFVIQPEDKVLETAAGTASNLFHLPEDVHYYGLDISFQMLKAARRKAENAGREIQLFQADAAHILSRLPAHKKYGKDNHTAIEGIRRLVPKSMQDVTAKVIENTDFYALSFLKPAIVDRQ